MSTLRPAKRAVAPELPKRLYICVAKRGKTQANRLREIELAPSADAATGLQTSVV